MFEIRDALVRMRAGDSDRQLALAGVVGRRKAAQIREWASAGGWLDSAVELPAQSVLVAAFERSPSGAAAAGSSVAVFHDQVAGWVQDGLRATTIHGVLKRQYGFAGEYSSVRRYVHRLRGVMPTASAPMEFEPGQAAQVDFGYGPKFLDAAGRVHKSWYFKMTLAWSRHAFAMIVSDQKVETWLHCHRLAFEWFGGVPAQIVIDNPKCAITKACYHEPTVQRAYRELAEGYGFQISPCPVADPQKKGRVEAGIKYLRFSFEPAREFRDRADANTQLHAWLLDEAGTRIHGTTRRQPLELFETERLVLGALPEQAPDICAWAQHKVHGNCHVQFQKVQYSAPHRLVNQAVWVRAGTQTIRIYHGDELVAAHPRYFEPGARSTIADHLPENAVAWRMRDPQWCLVQAERIGPSVHQIVRDMLADSVVDYLRAAQGLISLTSRFDRERVENASRRAIAHQSPHLRTVKSILTSGADLLDEPALEQIELPALYATGQATFLR